MAEIEEEAQSEFYRHPDFHNYNCEKEKWCKTDMQELLDSGEGDEYTKRDD